jgi:hypothetical protein
MKVVRDPQPFETRPFGHLACRTSSRGPNSSQDKKYLKLATARDYPARPTSTALYPIGNGRAQHDQGVSRSAPAASHTTN